MDGKGQNVMEMLAGHRLTCREAEFLSPHRRIAEQSPAPDRRRHPRILETPPAPAPPPRLADYEPHHRQVRTGRAAVPRPPAVAGRRSRWSTPPPSAAAWPKC